MQYCEMCYAFPRWLRIMMLKTVSTNLSALRTAVSWQNHADQLQQQKAVCITTYTF